MENLYINIFFTAGAGTVFAEILLKVFLSAWLERSIYKFKLKLTNKYSLADELVLLLNSPEAVDWGVNIQSRAYLLSDKLKTEGFGRISNKLDKFLSTKFVTNTIIRSIVENPLDIHFKEKSKEYIEKSGELDKLRGQLIDEARNLKR